MKVEDLIASINGQYLHFNRVDRYNDFPGADEHDSQQPPKDEPGNAASKFLRAPEFSAAHYYEQSRARTYACCFSLENSDHIWTSYGTGREHGKVAVEFDFGLFRTRFNKTMAAGNLAVMYRGLRCLPFLSVNYGIVRYEDWHNIQINSGRLPNPIEYAYLKDKAYEREQELRVTLSALGIGRFVLSDGSAIEFPTHLRADFDFRAALAEGTIRQLLHAPHFDVTYLEAGLNRLGIRRALS